MTLFFVGGYVLVLVAALAFNRGAHRKASRFDPLPQPVAPVRPSELERDELLV